MTKLNLGLAQLNTQLGMVDANLERHLDYIDRAKEGGADLIIFPELSLTGYALQDLATTVAIRAQEDHRVFQPLLAASKELDIMVGFVEDGQRHRFYIASAYLSQGRIAHVHRKVYLPTYALYDEGRFFAWGDRVEAFDTRYGRFGILICEDFWHVSPPYLLWLDGAEVMLFQSASPGRGLSQDPKFGTSRWVEQINQAYASLFTTFVAHTNRVGFEDGLNFWGGATVYDPDGDLVAQGPYHEEALTLAALDLNQLRRTRARLPLLRDERTSLMARELGRILSHP
jgi:predicted amidohydrolase